MSLCRSAGALLACSLLSLACAPAQTPPVPAAAARFSSEPYVIEHASTVLTMHADGTGEQTQTFVIHIQAESAVRSFGIVSIAYAKGSGTAAITYVRVHHADGSTQETPATDVIEQPAPVTREAPTYSDISILQLPVKNLRVGDTLDWQSRSAITHPEIPNQFYGQGDLTHGVVILDQSYELRSPLTTHPTIWTNPRAKLTFAETTSGTERIDRWSSQSLDTTVGPEADARRAAEEKRVLTPDEAVDLREGKLPGFAWTTFPDWAAVGAWYNGLARDRATPDSTVRSKVAELTAGKSTDQARAEALYNYVSSQIRYIGVSFGIGRFQPHTAAEVLSSQFGDCKDKHTLLASMLAAANLHADPVLIGAGTRLNPAVPSPASFNHLITHLTLDGQEVWLDSTAGGAPWRALQPVIREEQALVIPATGPAHLEQTPASLPYPAFSNTAVTGTLDPGLTGESDFALTFRTDDETGLRSILEAVSPADYGTFVQNLVSNLGFGGTASSPVLDNLNDTAQPLTIRFHYHRAHDSTWGENRITATFGPIDLPGFAPDKPPTAPIQLGEPRTLSSTVAVTLPSGWQAELPEPTHAHTSFATADVTFRLDHGKLLEERKVVVLKREIPIADFKQYQSWYSTSGIGSYPYIQLIPPIKATANTGHTAAASLSPAESSRPAEQAKADATALVEQAGEKIRIMDSDAARKLLDQARALNPKERKLWSGYAALASMFGADLEAIEDLKTELRNHPDETRMYGYLIQEQAHRGLRDDAIATARQWTEAAPESTEATLALVQQLSLAKQFAAAEKSVAATLDHLRASNTDPAQLVPLVLAKGNLESELGQKQKAAETVAPLLDHVTDPNQVNAVAYMLAEGGRDLPAAEAAQRKAVQTLENETASWSLTDPPPARINRQQAALAAAWDTLGWILFQEHHPDAALPYLQAAASLLLIDTVIHQHLSTVFVTLHHPARDAQALRSISLGPSHGRHGTADLRFLLVGGKVVEAGPFATDASTLDSTYKPGLLDGAALLKLANLTQLVPPGSQARLIRSGTVTCSADQCQLFLVLSR